MGDNGKKMDEIYVDKWQKNGKFQGQGPTRMMDCKAMTTPMASNLKLLSDASLEAVDAMMYRK